MKTIDLDVIGTYIERYWREVAIVILILLCYSQCSGNSELQLSAKQHEQNAKDYLLKVSAIKLEIINSNKKYKNNLQALDLKLKEKENKLDAISKQLKAKIPQITKYNATDIANYFKTHYNAPNDVKTIAFGTVLKDTLSKRIITDLVIGESATFENKELLTIVSLQKEKFTTANEHIDSLNVSLEQMSKNYELANVEKDKANTDLNKALQKTRNKGTIFKYTTYALAGFLIYEKTK